MRTPMQPTCPTPVPAGSSQASSSGALSDLAWPGRAGAAADDDVAPSPTASCQGTEMNNVLNDFGEWIVRSETGKSSHLRRPVLARLAEQWRN